ncbi:uncharacterized protein PHALS_06423 [Plasmopara halstedii]|uniref:Uncharacterized protein n=1 Tax=Plasmopara halstedii TaxID=4781 RepID=A0A0P1B3C0_PLAHL|nr:uncharacterized protein PHALS_06423 [Plasmopara halstedii]CEG48610.1 hypothetical protein PHALS_06423 [Plasmopara halstedii]|eukprot:XP_024584979.1 hypothetical protein PHALS_06423 [Plasmopara halstedii]
MFSFCDDVNKRYTNKLAEIPGSVHAETARQVAREELMEEYFLLLNVIKAQRIIDTPKILNLRRDQIDLIKENTFSFWKSRGMTPDDLSQILVHMDKPESDLVKWKFKSSI